MADYDYHLGIYSKLIRGGSTDGPIKPGVEAKVIGTTKDFPTKYQQICTTSQFFPENPPITKIDARSMPGGAFVYAPVLLEGELLSVFSRIEAKPERGEGKGGRKFTHCASLIVRDRWEPGLIVWAARMLFTKELGGQTCWGDAIFEKNENRSKLPVPELMRVDLAIQGGRPVGLPDVAGLGQVSQIRLPVPVDQGAGAPTQVDVAHWWADVLAASGAGQGGYAAMGRFLSFACGTSEELKGPSGEFFLSLDTRTNAEISKGAPLGFDDKKPPFVAPPAQDLNAYIPQWRRIGPFDTNIDARRIQHLRSGVNFWPDQEPNQPQVGLDEPAAVPPDAASAMHEVELHAGDGAADPGALTAQQPAYQPAVQHDPVPQVHELLALEGYYDSPNPVALEVDARVAKAGLYDDRDPMRGITWPQMQKYAEHPQEETYPLSREMFHRIGRGFSQLYRRLALIEAAPFNVYPAHSHTDRLIVESFRQLLQLLVDFCATGQNPNDLNDHLDRLFDHPSLPNLGIWTEGGNSLTRFLFVQYANHVQCDRIIASVNEIARRERTAAAYQTRVQGRSIQVGVPNPSVVSRFFEEQLAVKPFEIMDQTYEENHDQWWQKGLGPLFAEMYASSIELFADRPVHTNDMDSDGFY